ncbi:Tyrosine-protein phosphatase 2 [Cytospora mali]|uniref:Tyrosine-protein phosphatase 2 n=1 Tax=Cytospora mali TaxID=578113 RepID=A0A194VFS9_CYTMA|nr:Tyrosine-protein phosphatase 2 [Valsa mali var. pyri (nom. inval.)]
MDRLRSGFHRKTRKNSPTQPTIITDSPRRSGNTTPETASLPPQSPQIPYKDKKLSPFRSLRELSRSHKRARSPPAGSLPQRDSQRSSGRSQATTGTADSQPLQDNSSNGDGALEKPQCPPKMPSFLSLSALEIEAKFQEIVWMERNRTMQSFTNPSPDLKWARVTGDHLKKLDRYMNIQPWQNNRVKLKVPPGKVDYINASPITLTSIAPEATRARSADQDGTIIGLSDLAGGGPDRYIAMQGPKAKTADHVWRMVVEQLESPGVIVMLTETHEANMEKCYPYFPRGPDDPPIEVNKKDEFGDGFRATVRCEAIEETEAGEAIELRKLVVRVYKDPTKAPGVSRNSPSESAPRPDNSVDENGDVKMLSPLKTPLEEDGSADDASNASSVTVDLGQSLADREASTTPQPPPTESPDDYEERIVWHFLYKKWPDFGVPALEDIDSFFKLMQLSREKNAKPENPRIVHCSAGVGRSGTFIALEHLIRELEAGVLENWDSPTHFRKGNAKADDDDDDVVASTEDPAEVDMGVERQEAAAPAPAPAVEVEGDDLIFHTVNQLREQRRHMVQADTQFLFLYQVMRKLWEDKYGPVGGDDGSPAAAAAAAQQQQQITDADYMGNNGAPAAKRLEVDPFVEE